MCLSTVVKIVDGKHEELCTHISSVKLADGQLTFTDIMGRETVFSGCIDSIDLVDNKIFVSAS